MNMTRQEIYDHIWTRTVQGFADEFNLNYPMLLRRIKEADIPKPSRKEILFIRQGEDGLRAVHRPELPGDPEEEVRLAERREPEQAPETTVRKSPKKTGTKKKVCKSATKEKEPEQAVPEEIPELIDYEKHPRWTSLYFLPQAERRKVIRETENIRLKDGEPVHPTVIALQREIAAWQTQVDILGDEDFASAVLDKPSLLDRVSEENVERVFRILDSLYTSVELLGEKVLPDGSVAIHDQVVNLRFTESRARVPADPSVYDELNQEGPKWTMQYTGKLTLSAGYLYSIRDRKKAKVEDRLGDALELLFLTAFQLSQDHESRGDREAFESFNRELERTEELIQLAKDYEDAERIRKLLKAVQKKLGTGELEYKDYFPTWAAWASEKAEWLDPTVGFHDAILGRRHDPILQPPKNNS